MPEEDKIKSPLTLPEMLFVGGLLLVADTIEALLLLFALDDFGISDAIAFPATQIYLKLRGVRGFYCLIGNCLELVPYLGALPLRTITFGVTMFMESDWGRKTVGKAVSVAASRGKLSPEAVNKFGEADRAAQARIAARAKMREAQNARAPDSFGAEPYPEEAMA
ncbi:MAG: hypothetical protein AAB686_01050 [Patescibacteria group bacterium]